METATSTGMTAIPPRLFEVLDQEVSLSEEMVALLEQEKAALVAVDMQGLIAITSRKTNRLNRIQALDMLLQEMTGQLAASAPGKPNLASVINLAAPGEERERLLASRQRLLGLREEIIARNAINHYFAADTQRYLNDAISLITNALAENHDSYQRGGNPGRRPPSANRPSLISKAV